METLHSWLKYKTNWINRACFLVESSPRLGVRRSKKLRRGFGYSLRWLSITLIFAAVLIAVYQLVSYSRQRANFPNGTVIAGVSVGGLDQTQAADRLNQAYSVPIELHYGSSTIQVRPSTLDFNLDLAAMIAAADMQRTSQPFWTSFWDFLWSRTVSPIEVPLRSQVSEARIRTYLQNEIIPRYDSPPQPSMPIPGTPYFEPGTPGTVLDVERGVELIGEALQSPTDRVVNLTVNRSGSARPALANLRIMLEQIIDVAGFDGLTEIYIQNLGTGEELHFAYELGEEVEPDIAFTAASSIKIPVMVSIFRQLDEPAPQTVTDLLRQMIERSDNIATDAVMQTVLDQNLGPLMVTADMQELGLENTFLAGYFYVGAPLLQRFTTDANSRTDYSTNPDVYNQTTPVELAMILEDIYQCAQTGGGTFALLWPGEVTQAECQLMLSYLRDNRIGVLLQAGLPDGTPFAHKHGWITEGDGLMHVMTDGGIVFSSGADYVIVAMMYQPTQLIFEPANQLFADLSTAVYNYFNLQ
jgi:beta-lactamase class A